MEGAISQVDTFEYKPQLQKDGGKAWARRRHADRVEIQIPASMARPAPGFRSCFPHIGQARGQALLPPRPAHRYAGPSASSHSTAHRQRHRRTHPAEHGRLAALWPGHREPGPARLHHHQPAAQLRRGGQLRQRVPAGPLSRDADQRPRLHAELEAADCRDLAAAQATRSDPVDEPRSGGNRPVRRTQVDGVIQSYELAFQMQDKVPELLDISREPQTRARRLRREARPGRQLRPPVPDGPSVERGGRALRRDLPARLGPSQQPAQGSDQSPRSRSTSRPPRCSTDLEQRGLLDETLVLFGSEFGRQPTAQGPDGRDHNITGYPMWLAGAGVKKGFSYGATDEYGIHAVEGRMHINDLHATLLALMGLDHERADLPLRRPRFPPDGCRGEGGPANLFLEQRVSS